MQLILPLIDGGLSSYLRVFLLQTYLLGHGIEFTSPNRLSLTYGSGITSAHAYVSPKLDDVLRRGGFKCPQTAVGVTLDKSVPKR